MSAVPTPRPPSALATGPAAHRPPSIVTLAWRQWLRDLRAGELRLLMVAVALAVAALTAVGFFAERLNGGLARDARALLGGDAVVASDRPLPPFFAEEAARRGLAVARNAQFPSMARATDERGGGARLASLKAVSGNYPLRGTLSVGPEAGPEGLATAPTRGEPMAAGPARGTVWVDGSLLEVLGLREGDELLLGDARLRIARRIFIEPDRGMGFSSFAPRVMLHEADLDATALVQPASRVRWRLAVAAPQAGRGGDAAVQAFVTWAEQRIEADQLRGVRIDSLEGGQPAMRNTLDRARMFLNLVALLAALLAAVAVAIAARDFAQRHLDDCAVLRVLGQPQRRIAGAYLLEFGFAGLAASVVGVLLGLALHGVFVWLLKGLMQVELPPPGGWPAVFGIGVGLTLLLAFGAPPVLQLAQVPPLRVIRRDLGELRPASAGVLAAGVIGFSALLLGVASDLKLGAIAVGGFAAAMAVFALAAWGAVRALRRAVPEAGAPRWLVLATRQIAARPAYAVLQVSALAVGLLALSLLVLLRTDLIASWRAATPPDAPNRFVINVMPEQAEAFRAALARAGVLQYDWYPMIRGRLVAVNGRDVGPDSADNDRARRSLDRELNLSHAAAMPAHNRREAGEWPAGENDGLSVEEGIAESLGLKMGDRVRFDIGGQQVDSRVVHLRKVDWGSMRVNFFMMFTRAEMPELPATYIAALRAPAAPLAGGRSFDAELAREFPNITAIDVSTQIAQVQKVLDQVIRAVEFLFGFTLATGLTVLFAAITATRGAREREFALLRAMGAGSRLLAQVQRAELLGLGALAGAMASGASLVIGWALARYAFEFTWQPAPWVPLAGAVVGALLALAAGWWGLRGVLQRPVVETLRRATDG
jgi:putative ABC transport system permease protein